MLENDLGITATDGVRSKFDRADNRSCISPWPWRKFNHDCHRNAPWADLDITTARHKRSDNPPSEYFHGPGSARRPQEYMTILQITADTKATADDMAQLNMRSPVNALRRTGNELYETVPVQVVKDIDPDLRPGTVNNPESAYEFFLLWDRKANYDQNSALPRKAVYTISDRGIGSDRLTLTNGNGTTKSIAMGALFRALHLKENRVILPRPNTNGLGAEFLDILNNHFLVAGGSVGIDTLDVRMARP